MRAVKRGTLQGLLLVLIFAIGGSGPAFASDSGLLVFAAASLKNAMDDVTRAYRQQHAGAVRVSYAGSSTLARQIELGAPAAVYVSANRAWMDRLAERDLLAPGSRVQLLRNRLVLIAPRASDVGIDLAAPPAIARVLGADGYLAMANADAVPAGIYARQALAARGLWSGLETRVAQAEDVRAALALVARGEAPLGIVYASDAVAEPDVRVVDRFADASHDPIIYPAAIVAAHDGREARDFMAFLQSETAATIFERWGFGVINGRAH